MKVLLINYADDQMLTSQHICSVSGLKKGGITEVRQFSPAQIDEGFFNRNEEILTGECRGGGTGFWLWKPYICELILREEAGNYDYIVYADSGVEFIASLQPIFDIMEKSGEQIFLFGNNHKHIHWCRKEIIQHMWGIGPEDVYLNAHFEQVQASVIIFKPTAFAHAVARAWLAWSQVPGFITDETTHPQIVDFKGHRNDQSILTNIALQCRLKFHWWPAQYGFHVRNNYPDTDRYGQLFYHHRYRQHDWAKNGLTPEQFMNQPKHI